MTVPGSRTAEQYNSESAEERHPATLRLDKDPSLQECATGEMERDARRGSRVAVSVIVPTYNYGRFIASALDSVRAQTYADWECVVVDDGSTDGTGEIVASVAARDPRVRYVAQANAGPSAARNTGLGLTTGEFVQFLDADDLIGPRKLQRQIDLMHDHPEADLAYGGVRYFSGEAGISLPSKSDWLEMPALRSPSGPGHVILPTLLRDNIMVVEAPLLRRSLVERLAGLDPRLHRMEDWEFWLRCALAGAVFLQDPTTDPECLSYVRVHGANSSQDQVAMARWALVVRRLVHARLETAELRRLNDRMSHETLAGIGVHEGLRGSLLIGMRSLLRAGVAERNVRWLLWCGLLPILRVPPGRWGVRAWRAAKARRKARHGASSGP